jgi:hypothetical protein
MASSSRSSAWWARWKRLAHRAAEIQAYVLLSVLYALVVIPVGLARRWSTKSASAGTQPPTWQKRTPSAPADPLQEARQQF